MTTRYAPDFWKDFHCLGAECPDTCCSGWTVPVTKQDMQVLKKKASKIIPIMVEPMENNKNPEYFHGKLKMNNGHCVMLKDGWCTVVKKYGDNTLPSICHDFPRVLYQYDTHQETYLSTACPSVTRLMMTAVRSLAEAPSYAFKEERRIHLQNGENDWNHRELASIIIDTCANPVLWAILSLWAQDLEKDDVATLHWSQTLAEGVPEIPVKPWLEGQHHLMDFMFKRHLKSKYDGFQGRYMKGIVAGYQYGGDESVVFARYQDAHARFHKDPVMEHVMRQFVYFEMLRLAFPVQQGVPAHEQLAVLAYMWGMIRWLGFGYALSVDRALTLEEWSDIVYLHGRWYHHNASYQEIHHELGQSEGWSAPEKLLGLMG